MDKIQILTTCQACSGKSYIPMWEEISMAGHKYIRHNPCPACDGTGKQTHWIDLHEFTRMLTAIAAEEQEI